jgi:16S rRNA G966 N2-methylase RsmD
MRIISGKYKGRLIEMPKKIRPTQGKVRKALFDILGDIEGLSFLELYSGSGAVGFEAVSRGVSRLTLIEYDPDCSLAIKKNIESLKLSSCSLYPLQAEKAIKAFFKQKIKFHIIFMDPPYYKGRSTRHVSKDLAGGSGSMRGNEEESLSKKTLKILGVYDILAPYGLVVSQHFKKDDLPAVAGDLRLFRQARYGDTILSFYRKCAR